jgi:nucleotidyltransferase substrate binding protein (TIGR01987 family)
MAEDIRWVQRFDSYQKALSALERAVNLAEERPLTELEEQGLIQGFEFTHELAWNLLKDYLEWKNFTDVHGSRDTTRLAFKEGLLDDGEAWMEMIKSRNQTSRTYNSDTADTIAEAILSSYIVELRKLSKTMNGYIEKLPKE